MHWAAKVVPIRPPVAAKEAVSDTGASAVSKRNVGFAVEDEAGDATSSKVHFEAVPDASPAALQSDSEQSEDDDRGSTLAPPVRKPTRLISPEAESMAPSVFAAVKKGDLTEIARLLADGADLAIHDTDPESLGCTALHYAALCGRTKMCDPAGFSDQVAFSMVAMLLDADAPVNALDEMGFTPLHCAAALGLDEVVAELLSRGAFMDIQDHQIKYTPLHAAAAAGRVGVILLMIQAGAFVDEQVARIINSSLSDNSASSRSWPGLGAAHALGNSMLRRSGGLNAKTLHSSGGQALQEELQVQQSPLSVLQKGRTDNVLPNGGGRVWALKDTTGMGIWDVLDSPATACGVLDVLLQDLAHLDLMGTKSLVQLIQQTQSLRYVIGAAQKVVASEAQRTGMAPGEVASQLDAVKNYLTRTQVGAHQHSMKHPQRNRMPLPILRPSLLDAKRSSHTGGKRMHLTLTPSAVNMMRSGSAARKARTLKGSGSRSRKVREEPAQGKESASEVPTEQGLLLIPVADDHPHSPSSARTPFRNGVLSSAQQSMVDVTSLPALPGQPRQSPGLGPNRPSISDARASASYTPGQLARAVTSDAGLANRSSTHQPGSLFIRTSAGGVPVDPYHLPAITSHKSTATPEHTSVTISPRSPGPVGEGLECDEFAELDAYADYKTDMLLPGNPTETHGQVQHHTHIPMYHGPLLQRLEEDEQYNQRHAHDMLQRYGDEEQGWMIGTSPWCIQSDQPQMPCFSNPGPVAEGVMFKTEASVSDVDAKETTDSEVGAQGRHKHGAIARAWQAAQAQTQAAKEGKDASQTATTSVSFKQELPPRTSPPKLVSNRSLRRSESGIWRKKGSSKPATHEEQKPVKPAPSGFKVWTATLETKLGECTRCIQWQALKLEQYVEAVIGLARDAPSFHLDAEPVKRNRKPGLIGGGFMNSPSAGELLFDDDNDESLAGVELVWEMVRQSITLGDRVLSHLLVDRLVCLFPRALLRCPWSSVMVDMCQVFPEVFHHLLICLKDVSDEVRTAFVTSFNLGDVERKLHGERTPSLRPQSSSHLIGADTTPGFGGSGPLSPGVGLKDTKGRDKADMLSSSGVLATRTGSMIQLERRRPSMSLVNRVGSIFAGQQVDLNITAQDDVASFKYTLYRNLVLGLHQVDYTLMKCFVEKLDRGVLKEMAQMSIYKDFVSLLPSKLITRHGGGPDVINEEMGDSDRQLMPTSSSASAKAAAAAVRAANKESESGSQGGVSTGSRTPGSSGALGHGSSGALAMRAMAARRNLRGSLGKSTLGGGGPAVNETKAEVLNVEGLLYAALAARSAESVQAAVDSLVAWVEMNAKNKRLCFIDGLSTALVSQMATHFPSAAGALFHINPQASRDIKVSSWLLGKAPMSYQCSNTRYSFMWRQAELEELEARGYELTQVEQLADHNMRFMYICRAAQQGCSVDDILELMDLGLMGHHIADLVSSGARLESVKDALERGLPPELLASMLTQKLSWQLVEVLLHHRVTRTTVEDRTLRMDLLQFDAERSGTKHNTFSHAFVARFLEKWSEANWEKAFIDKVFHASDTLCTKLKTAYDYKLSMRTNYMGTHAANATAKSILDWPRMLVIMSAFLQPRWVLTRWLTVAVFTLFLLLVELAGSAVRALMPLSMQEHTVDATAKVLPIINAATLGSKSLLAGLMYADVPSAWYGTPVARAVIAVQWKGFAQVLMAMHLLEHMLMMVLYGVFLLLVHRSLYEHQLRLDGNGVPLTGPVDPSVGIYTGGDLPIERVVILQSAGGVVTMTGLIMFSFSILVTRLLQIKRAGFRLWSSHLANHVDVLCSTFTICTIVTALNGVMYTYVLSIGALGALVMFMRLMLFASLVERMGSLVRVVTEILKDLRYFFILIATIFCGFAVAFAVQLGGSMSFTDISLQLFSTMTGDFTASMLLDVLQNAGDWLSPRLALALWILYGFLVGIVFVALLISIMNDTFDRIKDAEEVEVLRNKARIIVDLQTLLPAQAMRALQNASLGPFLHTLNANNVATSGPTLAKVDEWQGRMQQIRNAVRLELTNHLSSAQAVKKTGANADDSKEHQGLHKELTELHVTLRTMRSEMTALAKVVADLQAGKGNTNPPPAGVSSATNPAAAILAAAAGPAAPEQRDTPNNVDKANSGKPTIQDLMAGAASILGSPATVLQTDDNRRSSTAGYKGDPAHQPSPAVLAALEGRTMLRMGSLPGKYFAREIPSIRGVPNAVRQTMWKVAARLAANPNPLPRLHKMGLSKTQSEPNGAEGQGTTSLANANKAGFRSLRAPASSTSGRADTQGSTLGQSGLLTRFAIQTVTSLRASRRTDRQPSMSRFDSGSKNGN